MKRLSRILSMAAMAMAMVACAGQQPGPADEPDAGGDPPGTPDSGTGGGADANTNPGPPDAGEDPSGLAAACSPVITYSNTSASGTGAIFDQHVSDVQAYFAARSLEVCKVLYKQASEVPPRPTLKFVVEASDGVAYTACGGNTCDEMHLNSGYLSDFKNGGGNVGAEIDGVIVHELTHVFQHMAGDVPGWVIEGEADFVRYRAGYIPIGNRHPGGNYDDAYQTTAFFFDYVDRTFPGSGWKLNQSKNPSLNQTWTDHVFVDMTGKTVQVLWNDYQQSL